MSQLESALKSVVRAIESGLSDSKIDKRIQELSKVSTTNRFSIRVEKCEDIQNVMLFMDESGRYYKRQQGFVTQYLPREKWLPDLLDFCAGWLDELKQVPEKPFNRKPTVSDEMVKIKANGLIAERAKHGLEPFKSRRELAKAVGCSPNRKAIRELWEWYSANFSAASSPSRTSEIPIDLIQDPDSELERLIKEQGIDEKSIRIHSKL